MAITNTWSSGGKMFLTLAGAMSTAELGLSLAEMIRQDKVHAICCTGANLEEDVFNLVAHDFYERVPNWRDLTPAQEAGAAGAAHEPRHRYLHPGSGGHAAHRIGDFEGVDGRRCQRASACFRISFSIVFCAIAELEKSFQIDRKDSWLYAAMEKNLPMFVPGWEDSTLGQYVRGPLHGGRH